MKRISSIALFLALLVVWFAPVEGLEVQEWTVTYYPDIQPACAWSCLGSWLSPDDDSAKVHYRAVKDGDSLISLSVDTTVWKE